MGEPFPLRGWGCCCSAGLALTVGFALQALLTGEGFTNMMAPSGGSVTTWKEDTHEIDVLLESFSGTEDTGSSVNQPVGPPTPALTNGQSVPFLPQLEVQFLPSTVKSLVPEPILSIVQSVLPLGSIAGDSIAKVTFTFLSAVLPPSD